MYPIRYKWNLTINGQMQEVSPLWNNSLSIDFNRESDEQFFRQKLSGKLTFVGSDYSTILLQLFDTKFELEMQISRDGGQSWTNYWNGYFYKTDCEFNEDNKTIVVTPLTTDDYDAILAGRDKEFNLIDLVPAMMEIEITKRPMIQIYVPGDRVISCILSAMNWEQEIEPISDEAQLKGLFHFERISGSENITVSGAISPSDINGNYTSLQDMNGYSINSYKEDVGVYDPDLGYIVHMEYVQEIVKNNTTYWVYRSETGYNYDDAIYSPVSGIASGTLRIQRDSTSIYARWVLDSPKYGQRDTFPIDPSDPVYDNRNYHYVYPYAGIEQVIYHNSQYSSIPTKYGLYQPGQYYVAPTFAYGSAIPIARSTWGANSIWYRPTQATEWNMEQQMWQTFKLNNAYPINSVIQALLNEIAPGISHFGTVDYSQFLYGVNPITNIESKLCITPKSNVLITNATEPAQKATITLKMVTDMLRDCFRCYWFIDAQKRFRIEHISYFMKGGSYSSPANIGIDLTTMIVKRNNKSWAYGQSDYKFDKYAMPERYQFAWMDDVTQFFEGNPLDVVSNYVEKGKIENVTVQNFTSDVDYMMLNPGRCSKDGFALLAATMSQGNFGLPFTTYYVEQNVMRGQNGYVSFTSLQQFYLYDMPAPDVRRNGVALIVEGTKRLKKNTVNFPCINDPNLYELIKTNVGNGQIEKLSINLSSRNGVVDLAYDTE